MSGAVYELKGEQTFAVAPDETVWLSASAGTGKTQVLSARVLRLLLQPHVTPSQILCLTFTKAGAAEMSERISAVLARWVRLDATVLAKELEYIGASGDPETVARARTLFASVLDCPGGGLRIDTIHAFAQWLLSAFPAEAGLIPGTSAMEDRDRDLLARKVLSDVLLDAREKADQATLDTLSELSLRLDPSATQRFLMRCANAQELWFGEGGWQPPLDGHVRRSLGLEEDASETSLARLCSDDLFDVAAAQHCALVNSEWGTKTGLEFADQIAGWLSLDNESRLAEIDSLASVFLTGKGSTRSHKSQDKIDPSYSDHVGRVLESLASVIEQKKLLELAQFLTPALTLGRKFALAWDEAKKREGLIDFDDQIRQAAALLKRSEMADWIRYKLDREFDHILVDEAQDTNEAQWQIIDALTEEYYAGLGQRDDRFRTLFVVGDYKQAIFGFQGTSPENFRKAKDAYRQRMKAAADSARQLRAKASPKELQEYGLGRSFRSSSTILDFVNRSIEEIGLDGLGLDEPPDPHRGEGRPGLVALWPPVQAEASAEGATDPEQDGESDGWLPPSDRLLASQIAEQVREWMDGGFPLVKGEKPGSARRATPGDVMVLVRKRRDLAGLIVARLHAAGVAVAGVDRLRLGNPLAVKDLLAALRFAVQPDDDLSLANLLVSPIMGWTQDDLLSHGYRPPEARISLWDHLRDATEQLVQNTVEKLRDLLARADFDTPLALLHWILVGPWRARKKLLSRLGTEAADPIDELINAAQAHEASHTPGLQDFLHWFDAGEGELKREAEGPGNQVRVMTVHGSKGLQAPIVILADATGKLDQSKAGDIELPADAISQSTNRTMPIPAPRKELQIGPIKEVLERAQIEEAKEHLRLLYVAMTRAEEALFIGGALGKTEDEPDPSSWYARLAPLFAEAEVKSDELWESYGEILQIGSLLEVAVSRTPINAETTNRPMIIPEWAVTDLRAEPRPPRPLAPSSAGEDDAPSPPRNPGADPLAAERGVLIHSLLERLPDIASDRRQTTARNWIARHGANFSAADHTEIIETALGVLNKPGFKEIFAPDAMAEVPLAANLGTEVVYGIADRLLVSENKVTVVDFKTTKRPPGLPEDIPRQTLRQMAAYVCALEKIYPDRKVRAAVLYTHSPVLFEIADDQIMQHKRSLLGVD